MAQQTGETDLLTLALRRAHAEAVEGPEPPPDDEDASASDTSEAVVGQCDVRRS